MALKSQFEGEVGLFWTLGKYDMETKNASKMCQSMCFSSNLGNWWGSKLMRSFGPLPTSALENEFRS
jgi:hypothetical protein